MFSKLFHKQFHTIHHAALVLAGFTLLVQITGLIRDRLLAGRIGPGTALDLYTTSFILPDLIFALGASLVSVTILMPFLAEKIKNRPPTGEDVSSSNIEAQNFINSIFTVFFLSIVLVSILVFIFMPILLPFVAPGFDPAQIHELVGISRIMLLSPIFLGISNLMGTMTQLYKKFFVYAASPVLYNVGIIIGILFLYPRFGLPGLVMGVVLGAFLHMAVQIPVILKQGLVPRLVRKIHWHSIWRVVSISIPRTFTLSCNQITLMVLYAFASGMTAGTISLFKFSFTLQAVPIAIIGTSYSVAAFPTLVEHITQGNTEKFIEAILRPARKIIFWSLPVIALFIVLRAQIVRVILGTGQFDWSDTRLVAASLAILVLGVAGQGLINLLVRGYYAAGKTWRPLTVNGLSTIVTCIVAFVSVSFYNISPSLQTWLHHFLRVDTLSTGTEVLALSVAYTTGTLFNFIVLWWLFKKEFLKDRRHILTPIFLESSLASIGIGAVTYGMLRVFDNVFNLDTFGGVLGQGFCAGIIGIGVGIVLLILMKNEEIQRLLSGMKRKIKSVRSM